MNILVLQHLDVEHPGHFRDLWRRDHHTWTSVELDAGENIPDLAPFDLLVVMGGPMDVWQEDLLPWLVEEKATIRRWVLDLKRPYVGICLGHQLLADALGGTVGLMEKPEVGIVDVELTAAGRADPVFDAFAPVVSAFQWHGAEVKTLPAGAVVLASNGACCVQAMRYGAHAYGFQFHCEITGTTVSDWRSVPAYDASLQTALGADRAKRLDDDVAAGLIAFQASAQRLQDNLARIVAHARAGSHLGGQTA